MHSVEMIVAFPPPAPPSISLRAVAVNLLAMVAVLAIALGMWRIRELPLQTRWRTVVLIVLMVAGVGGVGVAFEGIRAHLSGYFTAVWLVIGPTALVSLASQVRGRRPTTLFVMTCLAGIGCVLLLCLPLVSTAQEAGRRTQCLSNLRNIGLMSLQPENRARIFPARAAEGEPLISWRTKTYAYLYREERTDHIPPMVDLGKSWDDAANLALGREHFRVFTCPSNFNPTDEMGRYYTAYAAVTGPETVFPDGQPLPLDKITDGKSMTIMIGEASGLNIVWTEPRDIDISKLPIGINLAGNRRGHSHGTLSSYHPGGANVAFADGRVTRLSDQIDPAVLNALLTATGGEPVNDNQF